MHTLLNFEASTKEAKPTPASTLLIFASSRIGHEIVNLLHREELKNIVEILEENSYGERKTRECHFLFRSRIEPLPPRSRIIPPLLAVDLIHPLDQTN